ncbi:MAG: arsenosugar biosynthesis radical SAM protein ArsS [Leptospiraceae bacterium]|nr:arsenosugar biosynthesis radical SAM protein ArsS [Leptospiraceae bacterium]MDW8305648.1 arsenosugar biosynthesis radical SAM protein ArsS [Leptospiraceae bacterium]
MKLSLDEQLERLSQNYSFSKDLEKTGLKKLTPLSLKTLQVNVGKYCNQACRHCHVDASPQRTEKMSLPIFEELLAFLDRTPEIEIVDITGGAPELNPYFRYFVEEVKKRKRHVIDRCNLTVLFEEGQEDLPQFLAQHEVEIVASLPHYAKERTDSQRGKGVYEKSIRALQLLNELGYGKKASLVLNLVYNPTGIFLSSSQKILEREFKEALWRNHGIVFNNLYCINNMPINRFLESLVRLGKYETYMEVLVNSFNPATLPGLMCRHQISVGYDGRLYDCDFNQMLELEAEVRHIRRANFQNLMAREIKLANHCYGCTAGSGSSCGGELV